MIEGRDFPGQASGGPEKRFGFFATRWREADNERAAELAVVDAIRTEYREVMAQFRQGELTPTLHLAEIEELQAFPEEYPETGAAWYPTDDGH